MVYQNHVIDPTFFYDAIEEFAFNYDWYVVGKNGVDAYGNTTNTYTQKVIRGSLQTQGARVRRSKSGNTTDLNYKFYCKSLYRINQGDVIKYKDNYLLVNDVHEYDEYGVREAGLTMMKLTEYRDFSDAVKYLNGDKLV